MEVTLPETYPEVLPQFTLYNIKGLVSTQLNELKAQLLEVAEGYLGTVMVFALASEAQQWLLEHNDQRAEQQQAMRTAEELEYMKQKEEDLFLRSVDRFTMDSEVGLTRVGGAPVTIDNFTDWKVRFDEEMAERAMSEQEKKTVAMAQQQQRLTGRQYFEMKARQYLEAMRGKKGEAAEDGENVEFDEDLFLDDDDEEDDEDEEYEDAK